MRCIIVTPERTEADRETTFVAVPLFDGEYGVGQGHTPVVGRIGTGELRITGEDGSVERFCVEGGFMEVSGDVVSILTQRALRPEALSVADASELYDAAVAKFDRTSKLFEQKEREIQSARNRLRVARKWAGR